VTAIENTLTEPSSRSLGFKELAVDDKIFRESALLNLQRSGQVVFESALGATSSVSESYRTLAAVLGGINLFGALSLGRVLSLPSTAMAYPTLFVVLKQVNTTKAIDIPPTALRAVEVYIAIARSHQKSIPRVPW